MAPPIVLPFLLSMMLGRTIDLKSYDIGSSIYDDQNYSETSINLLNATYHVIEGDAIPYEFFGMPLDIVLRIKANYMSSSSGALGLDGLLKDTSWTHNSAVVAVQAVYTTVQRSLRDDEPTLNEWQNRIPKTFTHYASSLTYGGWIVVLYRFRCDIPSDVSSVRKTVVEVLNTTGPLDGKSPELWNLVRRRVMENSDVRGIVSVDTHVYSSVDIPTEITSLESLVEVIGDFPNITNGIGLPFFMDVKPLAELDKSYSRVSSSDVKLEDLKTLDRMFDDLRYTRNKLVQWVQEADDIDEDEEKVSNLLDTITECLRVFYSAVSELSFYKTGMYKKVQNSIDAYNKGVGDSGRTYHMEYLRLREDIEISCEKDFLHGVRGLLKVYRNEVRYLGDIGEGGIEDCKRKCLEDNHCKSIGYSDSITELEMSTGNYVRKKYQCWIYYRSTSTTTVYTPNGMSGDIRVYDRICL